MGMKHFINIEALRDETVDLGGIICERNDKAFFKGDIISITEKVDGSNASIRYDKETGQLIAFSRRQELTFSNTLDGFYNFVRSLNAEDYADTPNYVIFGEWLRKNKIVYNAENMHKWYVYSIYDTVNEKWLTQDKVKLFAEKHNLIYVHELYYGPFISWEHCKTFCQSPQYGETQEGIVVRNLSALERETHFPHILKIVNEPFRETHKQRIKVVDPEKEKSRQEATNLLKGIITRNRVEKMLFNLRDEGLIPETITPQDMGLLAKNMPARIYKDCMKEEPEIMQACGEFVGKLCSSITMSLVREIVMGS